MYDTPKTYKDMAQIPFIDKKRKGLFSCPSCLALKSLQTFIPISKCKSKTEGELSILSSGPFCLKIISLRL